MCPLEPRLIANLAYIVSVLKLSDLNRMNYSSFHEYFATYLYLYYNINKQDVLDHPEDYLGPNYKEVLNYWFYKDSLSNEQKDVYWERRRSLNYETRDKANEISKELASEVIDSKFVSWFNHLSLELIAAHLYIEQGIPFTYLPLIFDL